MSEINPDHPVTVALRDQWHKLLGIIMFKLGAKAIQLTGDDVAEFEQAFQGEAAVVAHVHRETIEVKLLSRQEAEDLERRVGRQH